MAAPDPVTLYCPVCETGYEPGPDEPWRCTCGHPLTFEEWPIPDGGTPPFSKLDTRRGLWTFFEFLPVSRRVSLGEGFTPLVNAPDWDAQFKLEYVFPTGSFKDRGATTTVSRAVELGVDKVVEDSSGNAGAAIAAYAARAGIDADVYVPAEMPQSKLVAIQRAGARPVRIEGGRAAVSEACVEAVEDGDGWYASHAWNPAFLAGTMTFALELAAQRDWQVPDAVVIPTGNGTLLLGAYRGFRALREAGVVDELPTLLVAQASGYAPIADAEIGRSDARDLGAADDENAVDDGNATDDGNAADAGNETDDYLPEHPDITLDVPGLDERRSAPASTGGGLGAAADDDSEQRNEIADGIHIHEPPRQSEIVAAIETTGGDAIAVGEDRVELALDRLHRSGFYVEPTAAVGPAALRAFRDAGVVGPDADVVVPLTGSGANTM